MKKQLTYYFNLFFGKDLELRVKLFHVLALTGFLICIIMAGISLASRAWINAGINIGAGLISLLLLLYSAKSGRYRLCYGISIVTIFLILFPSLFLFSGGYRGGMPFFFVFAVVFTVYMLEGWAMVAVAGTELLVYCLLCWLAYKKPEWMHPFATEEEAVIDIMICLIVVSVTLGATMLSQISLYRRQQEKLEKAQQQAEAASKAKSEFLANMSHEIRTPIHMILGMNELIHRESHSLQVRDYAQRIDETSKMLLSLVDSVLDVSKIESGKMESLPVCYESSSLVQTLQMIGRTDCKKKGLDFSSVVSPDLPPLLYGDLPHIRQIAANFLSNAEKYTEAGGITLTVSAEPGEEDQQIWLTVSVSDTGIGICPEAMPTLFDAFTRADLESHRHIQGTGLGLKIAKELAELMGGAVSASSVPGEGSTFTLRVPQRVMQADPESTRSHAVTFLAPSVRILAVDDNEGNRTMLRELLLPTQARVDTACSGNECLKMVSHTDYHIILMDYMMPGMSGIDTLHILRQKPGFRTPVIALTADATPETKKLILDAGFAACLVKPVPIARLRETMMAFLPADALSVVPQNAGSAPVLDPVLEEKLHDRGVYPEDAMGYFENNMVQYTSLAGLFLRHNEAEQQRVQALLADCDWTGLRFPVHALKGKAKNLGMRSLTEAAAYAEHLCKAQKGKELQSLMPYLIFLWQQGSEGLALLPDIQQEERSQPDASERPSPESLPMLLKQLRRKPALRCVDGILSQEKDSEARRLLLAVRKAIEEFAFDQARQTYAAYLEWKEKAL